MTKQELIEKYKNMQEGNQNFIKQVINMTIKEFFEEYEIKVEGEFKPFGVTNET